MDASTGPFSTLLSNNCGSVIYIRVYIISATSAHFVTSWVLGSDLSVDVLFIFVHIIILNFAGKVR